MNEKKTKVLAHTKRMILWALSERPATTYNLVQIVGVERSRITQHLRELQASGLVFKDGEVKTTGRRAPIYHAHVKHPDPRSEVIGRQRKQTPMLRSIVDVLTYSGVPMTVHEIAEFADLDVERVRRAIDYHRRKSSETTLRIAKWVYIVGQGRGWTACWNVGHGADAPQPPTDLRQCRKRWRDNNKALRQIDAARARLIAGGSPVLASNPFAQLYAATGTTHRAAVMLKEHA